MQQIPTNLLNAVVYMTAQGGSKWGPHRRKNPFFAALRGRVVIPAGTNHPKEGPRYVCLKCHPSLRKNVYCVALAVWIKVPDSNCGQPSSFASSTPTKKGWFSTVVRGRNLALYNTKREEWVAKMREIELFARVARVFSLASLTRDQSDQSSHVKCHFADARSIGESVVPTYKRVGPVGSSGPPSQHSTPPVLSPTSRRAARYVLAQRGNRSIAHPGPGRAMRHLKKVGPADACRSLRSPALAAPRYTTIHAAQFARAYGVGGDLEGGWSRMLTEAVIDSLPRPPHLRKVINHNGHPFIATGDPDALSLAQRWRQWRKTTIQWTTLPTVPRFCPLPSLPDHAPRVPFPFMHLPLRSAFLRFPSSSLRVLTFVPHAQRLAQRSRRVLPPRLGNAGAADAVFGTSAVSLVFPHEDPLQMLRG
ncbi:hypothetical protein C8R45DRAFT_933100 [Mycena sanguinolenta]|nr:hypothetical protein C8R45DRAFT_933100 [Mycena sanguinolenta]